MGLVRYLPTPSDRMGILWSLLTVEDSVILEYGPAGTTHFSMSLYGELGVDQQNRLFTTHMSEDDVVMGDVSRLEKALVEVDESFHPQVIFVVASSISAVIGTDLKGVCAYMQERVKARLIAFEQGGFRGDYSVGIREAYRLLAQEIVEENHEKKSGTYNILGASAGCYRMKSDVNEIRRLMQEAFGMEMNACLCMDTGVKEIADAGSAELNLVLREEALPAAKIIESKCGMPFLQGAPYGYAGTLVWLEKVGEKLGRTVAPKLRMELKKRAMEVSQYRMYGMMLKEYKPQVAIFSDAPVVEGLASFMGEIGFPVKEKISRHSLRLYEAPAEDMKYLPEEKDRMEIMKSLHHTLVLADDVNKRLLAEDNTYLRVSMPLVDGAQIAAHMPLMGPRGADFILETVEEYLNTLK
jgi:nitrogenase molybdenum-cofactor synthesis protein NifE